MRSAISSWTRIGSATKTRSSHEAPANGALRSEPDGTVAAVHSGGLERAFGRIFAVIAVLTIPQYWLASRSLAGQTSSSIAASLFLSALLTWKAAAAFRRPLGQRDLDLLAGGAAVLLIATRLWAIPASAFSTDVAYLMVAPVAGVWAAMSRRLKVLVPVLLTLAATGIWQRYSDLVAEQVVTTLATVAMAGVAAHFMRRGARHADADAARLSQRLAQQDAALAADEAQRRAATAIHDDVLSVLRSIARSERAVPWAVLVSKAQWARAALVQRSAHRDMSADFDSESVDLRIMLQDQVSAFAAELRTNCALDGPFEVPRSVAEDICAASGEALRNVIAHAGVREASLTATANQDGAIVVTIRDDGTGFDPTKVGASSTGLRNSIVGRLRRIGGSAEISSQHDGGTQIQLTWKAPDRLGASQRRSADSDTFELKSADLLEWARRLAPPPLLVFVGLMLPQLLSSLVLLCLHWQGMRWHLIAAASYAALLLMSAGTARNVSLVRMTAKAALSLAVAAIVLAAAGSLSVAPGTTDAFSYWVSGESAVLISVLYFLRGPVFGLTVVLLEMTAISLGLITSGGTLPKGAWVGVLAAPVLAAGLAAGVLAAFRSLSRYTELQLAQYSEGLRLQARAEAFNRVDGMALQNARRVAGPVLERMAAGEPPSEDLQLSAALADAELRDELLAPGFFMPDLADVVRAARAAGTQVTVNVSRQDGTGSTEVARDLLATALTSGAIQSVTLHQYAATGENPALLVLHVRAANKAGTTALRDRARRHAATVVQLGADHLLVRFEPDVMPPAQAGLTDSREG